MVTTDRFIFCGGGTGGHLFPGIAIALAIRKRLPNSAILFVGTRRGLEETVLPQYGFDYRPVRSSGFKNMSLIKKLQSLLVLPLGIWEGLSLIRSFRPTLVVGLGGYSALPVMIAAFFKRVRRAIQEQNAIPGLTNRLLAPFAHRIFISYESTAAHFPTGKTRMTGNPIREGLCRARSESCRGTIRNLLILGGSLGAHFINQLCVATLPRLLESHRELTLSLQTGKNDVSWAQQAFQRFGNRARVSAFIDNMASVYRRADLVISRAGATTLAELSACGLPAILIPYPHAANDHQTENARYFSERGAAILLRETEINNESFLHLLNDLLGNPSKIQAMSRKMKRLGHPEAADIIAGDLLSLGSHPEGVPA